MILVECRVCGESCQDEYEAVKVWVLTHLATTEHADYDEYAATG